MARRRRRLWIILASVSLLLGLPFLYAAWPGAWTFTVSPETTYITGPLDKNGYVDYVTALNERLSQGIKPEENANVLLWQVMGPRPEGGSGMPPEYWHWLGIQSPPEEGSYLTRWDKLIKRYPDLHELVRDDAKNDPIDWARYWPWTAEQNPALADYLRTNEKQLALVIEATRRPQYYNPIVPRRTDDWSDPLL
jgi:hypothetical protein